MRSAPALKNMFLDCIRKIIPANCTHILQKAFFKHALELVMNDGNEKAVLCGNDCKGDKYNGKKQYV